MSLKHCYLVSNMGSEERKPRIRFKGFTDDWEQRKLGELVISHNAGIYISKEDYGTGTNVIGVGNIYDNDIFDGEIYRLGPVNDEKFLLEENDLIYGESSLVPEGIARTVCVGKNGVGSAFAWHTRRVKLDQSVINSHFATLELNYNIDVRKYLISVSTQTALTGMTTEGYFGVTLSLPTVEEQAHISSLFKQLDNLITLHQRKYDKLVKVKKSMLEKMFPKNGSNVPEIRFEGFTDAWEQRKLGDIVTEVKRTDGNSSAPIMMITANDGFINQSDRYSTNNAGQSLKKYILLEKGELAYNHGASKLRPYGSCFALTTEEKARIPFVYHCFSANEDNPEFLSIILNGKNVERQLRRIVSSGARMDGLLNISFDEYTSIPILIPEKSEQNKIAEYFEQLDHLITLHQCKLEKLKKIKKSMLQKMFV